MVEIIYDSDIRYRVDTRDDENDDDVTSDDDDDSGTVVSCSYDRTSGDDDDDVETDLCDSCVSNPEGAEKCAACSAPFCSSPGGVEPHPYLPMRRCPNDYGVYVCGVARDDLIDVVSDGHYWLVEDSDFEACGKHVCGKCIVITGRCWGCIKVGTV